MRLYEQEKLAIESEVSKLRASPINERDSPYDMVRSSTMLSESRQELERLQSRVMKLEAFIVAQVCTVPCIYTLKQKVVSFNNVCVLIIS